MKCLRFWPLRANQLRGRGIARGLRRIAAADRRQADGALQWRPGATRSHSKRDHREGTLIDAAVNFSGSQQGGDLMLSYPTGTVEGNIGLRTRRAPCSDGNGNVFVTDFKAADIVEYAHGGA